MASDISSDLSAQLNDVLNDSATYPDSMHVDDIPALASSLTLAGTAGESSFASLGPVTLGQIRAMQRVIAPLNPAKSSG